MSHYKALCTAQVDLFLKTQGIFLARRCLDANHRKS